MVSDGAEAVTPCSARVGADDAPDRRCRFRRVGPKELPCFGGLNVHIFKQHSGAASSAAAFNGEGPEPFQ